MRKISFLIFSILLLSSLGFQSQAQFNNGDPFQADKVSTPFICRGELHVKVNGSALSFLSTKDGVNWTPTTNSCTNADAINLQEKPYEVDIDKNRINNKYVDPLPYKTYSKHKMYSTFTVGSKRYYLVDDSKKYQISYIEGKPDDDNFIYKNIGSFSTQPGDHRLIVHPANPRKWIILSKRLGSSTNSAINFVVLNAQRNNEIGSASKTVSTSFDIGQVCFYKDKVYVLYRNRQANKTIIQRFDLSPVLGNDSFLSGSQNGTTVHSFSNTEVSDLYLMPTQNKLFFYYKNTPQGKWNLGLVKDNNQVQMDLLKNAKIGTSSKTIRPIRPVRKTTKPTLNKKTTKPTIKR